MRSHGGFEGVSPLTHMNRHTQQTRGRKTKTDQILEETTAMKTVITFNSSLLTILRSRTALILIALMFGVLALSPGAQAVSPPPDGGYAGGNTAEGQGALLNLTSGTFNTAVGLFSLRSNTESNFNTAIGGWRALRQHRERQYSHWRRNPFKQHHRHR